MVSGNATGGSSRCASGRGSVQRGRRAAACGRSGGPLQRTEVAQRKDRTRRTADGSLPVQSLADLLAGLGTLSAVELRYEQVPGYAVPTLSELEPLHDLVFELPGF